MGHTFTPVGVQEIGSGDILPVACEWKRQAWDSCCYSPCFFQSLFCPCFTLPYLLGAVMNRLHGKPGSHPIYIPLTVIFVVMCFVHTGAAVFVCILSLFHVATCFVRKSLRQHLALPGHPVRDLLLSCLWPHCVILQMHYQIEHMTTTGHAMTGKIRNKFVEILKEETITEVNGI